MAFYRYLVLAAERKIGTPKPFIHVCRDLATKWEHCEPVQHRLPTLPILQALVSLAWNLKRYRWCGKTLTCFYGSARLGGVIYSRSTAFLLPQDLLESHNDATSVLLERRKTSNRRMAKVQHFKIVDKYLIKLRTGYRGCNRHAVPWFAFDV